MATVQITINAQEIAAQAGQTILQAARAAGFDNVSCDLIFGVPEQTLEDWERDLDGSSPGPSRPQPRMRLSLTRRMPAPVPGPGIRRNQR